MEPGKGLDLGKTISSVEIERGLQELNPGLHFDVATKQNVVHPLQGELQGVFFDGKHIGTMSRGMVPEFDVYDRMLGWEDIPMVDAERYDDSKVVYVEVLKTDPRYHEALVLAQKNDDNYSWDLSKGKLFWLRCMRPKITGRRIVRAGWRHTFSRIVNYPLLRITKREIEKKFKVDLDKYRGREIPKVIMSVVK